MTGRATIALWFASLCVIAVCLTAGDARAQDMSVIAAHPTADSLLASGIEHFSAGAYDKAQADFLLVRDQYPLASAASSATYMAARSAYRLGQHARVTGLLSRFSQTYPGSSHAYDAARLALLADEAARLRDLRPARLGVLLSMESELRLETQAMFNGIHLAVREHNVDSQTRPVQIVFRDSEPGAEGARRAVRELADTGVDLIVGTLFSDTALAAAEEARRRNVIFVAPLATDARISANNPYAFQANPSMEVRGELAARFAVNGLRMDSLGVVTTLDPDGLTEEMTDAFVKEVSRLGKFINLITLLPDERGWFQLPDYFPADTLRHVDAIYMPVVGSDRQRVTGGILSSMDRFGRTTRILGNAAWHDLPMRTHASKYEVTYVNDYFPGQDSVATAHFEQAYVALASVPPQRLAYSGYDVTSFLVGILDRPDLGNLASIIRDAPPFEGLAHRIHFDGSHVNRSMYYHRYRDGNLALIR